ncbi:MAG: hypothetical protein ABIA04_03865 [Pseudomonadota bacterium]
MKKVIINRTITLLIITIIAIAISSCNEKQRRIINPQINGGMNPALEKFRQFRSLNRHRQTMPNLNFAKQQRKMQMDMFKAQLEVQKQQAKTEAIVAITGTGIKAATDITLAMIEAGKNRRDAMAQAAADAQDRANEYATAQLKASTEIKLALIKKGLYGQGAAAPKEKIPFCNKYLEDVCGVCENADVRVSCACAAKLSKYDISYVGGAAGIAAMCDTVLSDEEAILAVEEEEDEAGDGASSGRSGAGSKKSGSGRSGGGSTITRKPTYIKGASGATPRVYNPISLDSPDKDVACSWSPTYNDDKENKAILGCCLPNDKTCFETQTGREFQSLLDTALIENPDTEYINELISDYRDNISGRRCIKYQADGSESSHFDGCNTLMQEAFDAFIEKNTQETDSAP